MSIHGTFTVQPLLKGVPLDDAAFDASSPSGLRSLMDRQSASPSASAGPSGARSTGIFNRARPVVESLDTFENNLYIGTSDGYLLHYVVDEQISADMDLPQSMLVSRTPLGFGKKIVEHIKVLPAIRVAIVLCDSTVSFYSLPEFAPYPQQAMPHIKGVTTFSIDEAQKGVPLEDGSFRLCVTKRRIIQFYNLWYDGISDPKDLSLPNGSLATIRWRNHVCFADAQDFGLIDVRAGRMITVLPVAQGGGRSGSGGGNGGGGGHHNPGVSKPVCAAIGDNEFLMASATGSGQTTIGIFCSAAGDPVRGTLQWSSYPRMLGVEYPYVAALLRNNTVEIHNILDQHMVQVVRFETAVEARALVQTSGLRVWVAALSHVLATRTRQPSSLSSSDNNEDSEAQAARQLEHAARLATVPARLLVAGKDSVSALVITPLVLQADTLLQQGRIEEAILLSERALSTISADNLHRERLSHEVNYVNQKAGFIYLGETLFDDAFGLFDKGKMDPRILIHLFEDVLQEPEILDHVDVYQGVRDAITRIGSIQRLITATVTKSGNEQDADFRNMLLANAKEVFAQFLAKYRKRFAARRLPRNLLEAVHAVDTALLGIWVDTRNTRELYALLSKPNECVAHLCEPKLQQSGMHYALSLWHRTRGNHKETMRIWKELIQGEIQDADFSNGLSQMTELLCTTTDQELIQEFGWWVLSQNEQLGLRIFMPTDPKRASALFDADQVLSQLEVKAGQEGIVLYLEYLVFHRKSDTPDHHSKLALWYIKILENDLRTTDKAQLQEQVAKEYQKEQQRIILNADVASSRMSKDKHSILGRTFLNFLQGRIASQGPDAIIQRRIKLLQHLLSSSRYQPTTILPRLESIPCLLAERGVVLGQTGRPKDCLRILVHDLGDFLSIEQFCANGGKFSVTKKMPIKGSLPSSSSSALPSNVGHRDRDKDKGKDRDKNKEDTTAVKSGVESLAVREVDVRETKQTLFMLLLREYLEIPDEHQRMVLVVHLLDTQAIYLDVAEVLDLLPPVWSIEMVQQFFIRSLRNYQHERRELQVIKGLTLGDHLVVSERLYKAYEEIGPILLTADTACSEEEEKDEEAASPFSRHGSGGFGSVYRARREGFACAAKECFASYADLSSAAVKKEVAILQQLRHRHIIQYFESLEHDGHTYILMDLAERGSLAGAIARGEVTDWPTKARLAHEVARGLEYIHCRGIIHRDLKTANVLLTRFMEVKLCDFGLAKVKTISASFSSSSSMSTASGGGFKGTLRWAAPEALDVRPKYSKKTDVYALGMVMWAMAANRPEPFNDQQDNMVVATLIRRGEREEIPEDTPADYRSWIEQCWHQDPNQRPMAKDVVVLEEGGHFDMELDFEAMGGSLLSLGTSINDSICNRLAACGLDGALDKLTIVDGHEGTPVNNNNNNNDDDGDIQQGMHQGDGGDEVIIYLRTIASKGNADAQLVLGWMCDHGLDVAGSSEDAPLWYRKAAEQGHATAQQKLGRMYESREGSVDVDYNDSEAAKWYRMAADQGETQAQVRLGVLHIHGRGVAQNDAEAAQWFRRAGEQGVAEAQFNLGLMCSRGQGVEQSDTEGAAWMQRAADQDMVEAQFGLGSMYVDGRGVEQSDAMAAMWYRRAAEGGHAAAQLQLGLMYHQGRGVDQSDVEAAVWLRKSAEQDNADAQVQLGDMYHSGRGLDKNLIEAVAWYRRSATLANTTAETRLGLAYENGHGVEKDYTTAARWYQQAAEHGDAEGQSRLGVSYHYGWGVGQSFNEAVVWYQRAADQGHTLAQKHLAYLYLDGLRCLSDDEKAEAWRRKVIRPDDDVAQTMVGVMYYDGTQAKQDYVEAVAWFRKAACHGHAEAEFNLGDAYLHGSGVTQSDVEAAEWYLKAATHGHLGAQRSIGRMYDLGHGVEQNDEQAFEWYTKYAVHSNRAAPFDLGSMYELGIGVERDEKKALLQFQQEEAEKTTACFHIEWLTSSDYRTPESDADAIALYRAGSGGFGSVYRAEREGQPCAAKECFASFADLTNVTVKREIAVLQRLRHRYIIQYFESVEHDGRTYILMDLAEKGSLAGAIGRGEVADWPTKMRLAHEIARGLEYIHCRGIIHRDLKTANVLLTRFMEVKLCDFGLAKVKTISASSSSSVTSGGFKGTLRWAAPEALDVRPKYSKKSDVYALGMVMWAMAANRPEPFDDQQDNMVVAMLIRSGEREEIPEGTPAEYRSWIEQCWYQDPNQRPHAKDIVLEDDHMVWPQFDAAGPLLSLGASLDDSICNRLAACGLDGALDKLTIADGHEGKPKNNNSSNDDTRQRSPQGDEDEVIGYLRTMASKGSADAQLVLGWMCDHGLAVAGSAEDAPLWYRKAAEQGHSTAQLRLGRVFESREGSVDANYYDNEAAKWYRMAADRGEAQAQLRLGVFHVQGRGVAQNDAEAAQWFRKAGEQGVAEAQFNLGLMCSRGQGVEQSDTEGATWMQRAADQDMVEAQFGLGSMYVDGRGVEQSDEMAAMWYRRAADDGHAAAQLHLGLMCIEGRGVDQSDADAVAWLRMAAEQDNPEAQLHLGLMYESGRGLDESSIEAVSWYRRSATFSNSTAEIKLGLAYQKGNGVDKDYATAASWYRRAADHGDAEGQFRLAMLYKDGVGVEQSTEEALAWFRKAADQGYASAQEAIAYLYVYGLLDLSDNVKAEDWRRKIVRPDDVVAQTLVGRMYSSGSFVHQDLVEAVSWFSMAASLGYAEAELCLGDAYLHGSGVTQNNTAAVEWYLKAATHGDEAAQRHIGRMYDLGHGVEQNDGLAFEWYSKCAELSNRFVLFPLGSMYELGIGVERDEEKALLQFQQEEAEKTAARFHIEWLTSSDYRTPKSDSDAIALYHEGATKGYVAALYNLGRMYETCRGVQMDRIQAMDWYSMASEQGHESSRLAFLQRITMRN
ncbi:hypothetical protein DFQ26_008389 [Actinomortierella ambigua]|nr:hypothetical protein DFQ26_008389 [Actinomortierella ambigua]